MTPYHRMCNRIFEHLNTAVIQMIQILSEKLKYKWKNSLKKLSYSYNCINIALYDIADTFHLKGIRIGKLMLYFVNIKNQAMNNQIITISSKHGMSK